LTTKFTQHTAASPLAFSSQLSALSKTSLHLANFIAPPCSSRESGLSCQVSGLRGLFLMADG